MTISGIVENIIFRNLENGYSVIDIDCNGELITCVGNFATVSVGESLELFGSFRNTKYGEQFCVETCKSKLPTDESSICRFLSSGIVKGVGEVTASNIVKKFGKDTFDIIENAPHKLAEIRGISAKKALEIGDSISNLKQMRDSIIFLQSLEISLLFATKIYFLYGKNTIATVSSNPYKLIEDIDGIGFLTADKIASHLDISKVGDFRIRAAIIYILKEIVSSEGSTFCSVESLCQHLQALVGEEVDNANNVMFSLATEGQIILFEFEGVSSVGLSSLLNSEYFIANKLIRLTREFKPLSLNLQADILEFERLNKISFDEIQKQAITSAINDGVVVITGGPGTGKTTIINCIISIFKKQRLSFSLCAPTGRAAKRLSEVCKEEAKTIHRLLDLSFKDGKGYFTFNENTRLDSDAVIVDEVSMVDVRLMRNLISAIKQGARLIIVGDKDQLPSVDVGNVLADIIASQTIATIRLEKIFRQQDESLIALNAHKINEGLYPIASKDKDFFIIERQYGDDIFSTCIELATKRLPKYLDISPYDIQILCPTKKGVCGSLNFNTALQALINPPAKNKKETTFLKTIFRTGDKVMQTANNYQLEWKNFFNDEEFSQGIFNGDIGIVQQILPNGEISVLFDDIRLVQYSSMDLEDLTLSYAMSIHKSQGSEFDVCIVPITSGHQALFCRNLLYTAITRAKKFVVLVGSRQNISRMIQNNYVEKRKTMLVQFLLDAVKKSFN